MLLEICHLTLLGTLIFFNISYSLEFTDRFMGKSQKNWHLLDIWFGILKSVTQIVKDLKKVASFQDQVNDFSLGFFLLCVALPVEVGIERKQERRGGERIENKNNCPIG